MTATETTYRGYTIVPSESSWKPAFDYYPTASGIDCDYSDGWKSNVRSASTIEEAKEEIDEIIEANL